MSSPEKRKTTIGAPQGTDDMSPQQIADAVEDATGDHVSDSGPPPKVTKENPDGTAEVEYTPKRNP